MSSSDITLSSSTILIREQRMNTANSKRKPIGPSSRRLSNTEPQSAVAASFYVMSLSEKTPLSAQGALSQEMSRRTPSLPAIRPVSSASSEVVEGLKDAARSLFLNYLAREELCHIWGTRR